MAEIKSTMEKVMERLAAMDAGAAPAAELRAEEKTREGMRLAAGFLRGDGSDPAASLIGAPDDLRRFLCKGMVETFLRNIVLPREKDQQQLAEKAMGGLLAVGQGDNELVAVFSEMKSVLDRYLEHCTQLRQQLVDHFGKQMGQMEQTLAAQTGMAMRLQPEQHPKFQEEWQRLQAELNDQYGRAIAQYKELVHQRLTM
ncbi:MAG: hypothetical protein OEV91_01550 [Desulfobulbaceae bacterium]|nr:hypothetical protein [Desulfobulbaceae bacterium]